MSAIERRNILLAVTLVALAGATIILLTISNGWNDDDHENPAAAA